MKTEITKKQQDILITSMRSIGLLAHEKDLPRPTRELLIATFIAFQKVLRGIGVCKPLGKDGTTDDGVHQFPLDARDQWESQK